MLPVVTIVGRLTKDAETRTFTNGDALMFTVAFNQSTKNQNGEWINGDPTYVDCTLWGDKYSHYRTVLTKGTEVIVLGKLSSREYKNSLGETKKSITLKVDKLGTVPKPQQPVQQQPQAQAQWAQPQQSQQPVQQQDDMPPF